MLIEGTAIVIDKDNIDTDVLYPGAYLNIDDPEKMKPYLFEGLDPALRDQCQGDTVLIVGENFGCGSSREHVPHAMKASGVRCVVGKSFARIFHRNCINLGIPILTCPEATEVARPGSQISIETDDGTIHVDGKSFLAAPVPPFMLDMLLSGGLIAWGRRRVAAASE